MMAGEVAVKVNKNSSSLSPREVMDIEQKISFELLEMQFKINRIASCISILGGLVVFWIFYGDARLSLLIGWYIGLFLANGLNVGHAVYFFMSKVTPDQIRPWLVRHRIIIGAVSGTWAIIGILVAPDDIQHQVYIITLMHIFVVGFELGTIIDFVACAGCLGSILIPYILVHSVLGTKSILETGHDHNLNIGSSLMMTVLGLILLLCCYLGYKAIRRSFRLGYENIALSEKLEQANKFLEHRVKERTLELEDSLKLVTYQSTHDLLTDLPNQRLLLENIQSSINSANRDQQMFGVIFFTLNEIEKINDGLGYQVGDLVIRTIAVRLQQAFGKIPHTSASELRYTVTLSRKDVFIILIEPITQLEKIEENAEKLFSVLEEPVHSEKQVLKLTASIGVSVYPNDGREIKSLLMNADIAMLHAKRRGGNSLNRYKADIKTDITKELEMEAHLHTALRNNEFILQYQPFVDLKTGEICGMEALVRWKSPTLGFISPMEFIPLAEANGVIIPLGEWVLRTACAQAEVWHEQGYKLKIAINLSVRQLQQKNLVQVIAGILKETSLKPEYIELELTETEAFRDETIPVLRQFKAMGLGLSIDDFGTGYSGLTNLKLLDIDKLKIDKSFVQDVVANHDSRAIVINTIGLAKGLNITVLAEGVETVEQLKFLQENGCNLIQGYYFSPPVNPDVFGALLESKRNFLSSIQKIKA